MRSHTDDYYRIGQNQLKWDGKRINKAFNSLNEAFKGISKALNEALRLFSKTLKALDKALRGLSKARRAAKALACAHPQDARGVHGCARQACGRWLCLDMRGAVCGCPGEHLSPSQSRQEPGLAGRLPRAWWAARDEAGKRRCRFVAVSAYAEHGVGMC